MKIGRLVNDSNAGVFEQERDRISRPEVFPKAIVGRHEIDNHQFPGILFQALAALPFVALVLSDVGFLDRERRLVAIDERLYRPVFRVERALQRRPAEALSYFLIVLILDCSRLPAPQLQLQRMNEGIGAIAQLRKALVMIPIPKTFSLPASDALYNTSQVVQRTTICPAANLVEALP